ncbi:Ribbon-helix-helix protein, copG family [Alteromonadaceae bacterium Bs31]|nr:Ribbon-helix-helix protein, copG family [Alteromonadaceae bacterium Bs31]
MHMSKEVQIKSGKKNTSLRLDSKTLKALKIRAIEEDSSVQAIMEKLITRYLANEIKLPKEKK